MAPQGKQERSHLHHHLTWCNNHTTRVAFGPSQLSALGAIRDFIRMLRHI